MLSREAPDAEKSGSAVKGRVLRTPLGHELRKCIELRRFWHGRGIAKFAEKDRVREREENKKEKGEREREQKER